MKKTPTATALAIAAIAIAPGTAAASARHHGRTGHYYIPRSHHVCRANFARRVVRVHKRRHGRRIVVNQVRCYALPHKATVKPKPAPVVTTPAPTPTVPAPVAPQPTPPTPPPAPPITYTTKVDPSFTQATNNPLVVTYAYDASAFAGTINLGNQGQLPAGILNLYSATSPGQPAGLICSMDVGGATTGGTCTITYSATGTYDVTTQYVPNAASAVTETDTETISPYTTTTSAQSTYTPEPFPQNGLLDAAYGVTAQGLGPITPSASDVTMTITDLATGQSSAWASDGSGTCHWYVDESSGLVQFQQRNCTLNGPNPAMPQADFDAGQIVITASYAGMTGWSGSVSTETPANS